MRRNTRRQEANERLAARLDEAEQALQSELGLLWRIHVLSYLMIRRVQADPSLHSGLSLIAWRIVITLASVPGLSANEIVLLWGLEKMGVNRAVKELLKHKLVVRTKDPHGARRQPLFLSDAGQEFFATAWPGAQADYASLASVLTPAELVTFSRLADKLIARAREVTA